MSRIDLGAEEAMGFYQLGEAVLGVIVGWRRSSDAAAAWARYTADGWVVRWCR